MASGAVITTAARIQEYAPPGAVVVCAATRRATAGLIDQRRARPGRPSPARRGRCDVWRAAGLARPRPAGTTAR